MEFEKILKLFKKNVCFCNIVIFKKVYFKQVHFHLVLDWNQNVTRKKADMNVKSFFLSDIIYWNSIQTDIQRNKLKR